MNQFIKTKAKELVKIPVMTMELKNKNIEKNIFIIFSILCIQKLFFK